MSHAENARRPRFRRGMAWRIAVVGLASGALAAMIVALGVAVVGGQLFTELMLAHGETVEAAHEMFDRSVIMVLVAALAVAMAASVVLAALAGRLIVRPLTGLGDAARRIAAGARDVRVPRDGPEELVELADSFNQMSEALSEQERLRREFIANAAHELRTPLTNLQGYLEALRDGIITAERATYESLWEEADRLVRLARSLDALAAGDRSQRVVSPIELNLAIAMESAVELVRPALDSRRISLVRRWPDEVWVRVDPDQLAQVLGNLLQNAVRYASDGGEVALAAEARSETVLVSVANHGKTIPAADLPRLFERFYRVEKSRDRARGGAGIGLAIVKQLVEAWGGRVGAESHGGRTSFWFSLPSAGRPEAAV